MSPPVPPSCRGDPFPEEHRLAMSSRILWLLRRALPVLAALAGSALAARAQYHDAGYLSGSLEIHLTSGSGVVTTLYDNPSALNGLAMDVDNRRVVFGDGGTAAGAHGLLRLDPAARTVTTVVTHPSLLYSPLDLVVNGDGDYVFTNRYATLVTPTFTRYDVALFKYSPTTSKLTTIATTLALGAPGIWQGGLGVDIDTGEYVVQDRNLANGAPLLGITDQGTIRTLANGLDPRHGITQDLRTGDWYSPAGGQIFVVRKSATSPTSLFAGASGHGLHSAVAFDRASAAAPRLVSRYRDALYFVDPIAAAVTSVVLSETTATPWEVTFHRGRNLASIRTAPGRYDVRLSFPGAASKAYAIGLSLTGVRPGVVLADNRVISLAPDIFTVLTVANLLPGMWDPGPLVLDAGGEATARLDVSGLPTAGLSVWCIALVLDRGAIVTIADPILLRL